MGPYDNVNPRFLIKNEKITIDGISGKKFLQIYPGASYGNPPIYQYLYCIPIYNNKASFCVDTTTFTQDPFLEKLLDKMITTISINLPTASEAGILN